MVEIRFPPPTRNITPKFEVLKVGRVIKRIFDPTRYNATPTEFRYFGPLSRFDHHRGDKPELNSDRGIIYAGFSLSCSLVEIFGDDGTIETKHWQIANITLTQSLKLLDLRGEAAWGAGSVTSMTNTGIRKLTQAWGRYFYENSQLYGLIDGLIFNNAHNGEDAIALYERAERSIASGKIKVTNLNDPALKESILEIANRLNLLVELE
ncbi:MAG: hypothetical protein RLZZ04_4335 [Cyanobacteriota bacterium]|jgi:hypothetical protein